MPITWDKLTERYFQYGLDRGVIYIGAAAPVPWNGLLAVDEQGGGAADIIYRDGKVIFADVEPSDFAATVKAFMYPDELSACLGIVEAAENLFVDNQKPKRFGLSYRVLVGSGLNGDQFGYQIHLLYNCIASIGTRSHKTMGETVDPENFDFTIVCTPIKLAGFRPSAHYILDTRGMNSGQLAELENLLYGVGVTLGRLPTPTELFSMMNFGVIMKVHDNGDGTVKITGASQYFTDMGNGKWAVSNMNVDFSPTVYKYDTFDRTVANGWGSSNSGDAWTVSGGVSSDYSVGSGYGQHLLSTIATRDSSALAASITDFDVTYDVKVTQTPVGGRVDVSFLGRRVDTSNHYVALLQFQTTGNVDLLISKRVAGAISTIVSQANAITGFSTSTYYRVRFRVLGNTLKAKVWDANTPEPSAWTLSTTDSAIVSAGAFGFRTAAVAGNTNSNLVVRFDNVSVNSSYIISDGGNTQIV